MVFTPKDEEAPTPSRSLTRSAKRRFLAKGDVKEDILVEHHLPSHQQDSDDIDVNKYIKVQLKKAQLMIIQLKQENIKQKETH